MPVCKRDTTVLPLQLASVSPLLLSSDASTLPPPQLLPSGAAGSPTFASAYEERIKGVGLAQVAAATFGAEDDGPVINDTMKEALKVVFSKDGSYAQEVRTIGQSP